MKRLVFAVFTLSLFVLSCGGGKQTDTRIADVPADTVDSTLLSVEDTVEYVVEEENPLPVSADELFDDFFFNYASNMRLQLSRTVFPLKTSKGDSISFIQRSEWVTDSFFTAQGYYTLIFDSEEHMDMGKETTVDEVVVEKIMLDNQQVKSYCFSRNNGAWMLRNISISRIIDNPNASFLDFYQRFATDSVFQINSLNGTVYFEAPNPDDDFERIEGLITSETWPAFAPELPSQYIYNIVYSPIDVMSDTKIFVIRGISNGLETEITFRREQGKWLLAKIIT